MSYTTFSTENRKAAALEVIGTALTAIGTLMRERLDKEFPLRPNVREAVVTHVKTTQEELELEQQGDPEDDDWGQRERDFLAQTRNKSGEGS